MEAEVDEESGRMMLDIPGKERRVICVEELVGGEEKGRESLRHSSVK